MESGRDARARLGFVYIFAVIKWIKDPSENVTARAFKVVLLCKNAPLALNHICAHYNCPIANSASVIRFLLFEGSCP